MPGNANGKTPGHGFGAVGQEWGKSGVWPVVQEWPESSRLPGG
jgi:hypothetical protein